MPDDRIKISDFSTPVSLNNDDVIVIVQNVGGVKTTYKAPLTLLATQLLKNMQFASDLQTTNKAIIGAINEVAQGGGGASVLNDLTDVTITNPSNGQVITYNAQTGKWVNGAGAEITLVNTASGAIATFSDGAAGLPLKSCNVEIKPKQASGTPTPSSPLPISGTDTVIVTQTGKNRGELSENNKVNVSPNASYTFENNGITVTASGTYARVVFGYKVETGKKYTVSFYGYGSGNFKNLYYNNAAEWGDSYGRTVLTTTRTKYTKTITANSNFLFVGFYDTSSGTTGDMIVEDFMIEEGDTATAFEPYTAQTQTLSLPETVYGGNVDVIGGSGESKYALANLSDLSWENAEQSGKTIFYAVIADKINNDDNIAYCEIFASATSSGTSLATAAALLTSDFMICTSKNTTSPRIYVRADGYTDTQFANAISGYKVAYQLATPTSITLANPIELTTKSGVNNVFGDTDGNTSVEYFNLIAGDVANLVNFLTPHDASELDYDNTSSGLAADDVQSAIDEVADSLGIMNTATLLWTGDMHGSNAEATIPNLSDYLIVGYSVDENEDYYISIGTAVRGGTMYGNYGGGNIQSLAHRFTVNGNTISVSNADRGITFQGSDTYSDSVNCHIRKVYGLLKKPTISNS